MNESPLGDNGRRVGRALLLTVGPAAEAVAGRTVALGRAWLGTEPPVRVVGIPNLAPLTSRFCEELGEAAPPAVGGPGGRILARACDELAGVELAATLRAAGLVLARSDEIQAWLVVDVAAPAGEAPAAMPGTVEDPRQGVEDPRQGNGRLAGWLADFVAGAQPLWPGADATGETWLLTPARKAPEPTAGGEAAEERLSKILVRGQRSIPRPIVRWGAGLGDAVVAVRWGRVELESGNSSQEVVR